MIIAPFGVERNGAALRTFLEAQSNAFPGFFQVRQVSTLNLLMVNDLVNILQFERGVDYRQIEALAGALKEINFGVSACSVPILKALQFLPLMGLGSVHHFEEAFPFVFSDGDGCEALVLMTVDLLHTYGAARHRLDNY
jgi:hypothetical protein